jgi:hypothetical protein
MTSTKFLSILHRITLIWGGIVFAFLAYMLGAHLLGAMMGEGSGEGFRDTKELISFICFPVGVTIGLGLALKWNGLGGLIATISMIGLYIGRPDLILDLMFLIILIPGLLNILSWYMSRNN